MGRKAKQITDLEIDEISLVDKGANQHAVVTIAKSADGEKEMQMEIYDEQGNPLDPEALDDGDVVYDAEGNAYRFDLDDTDEGVQEEAQQEERQPELVGKSADNPFRRTTPVRKSTTSFASELREELSKALTDRDRDEIISKALGQVEELSKAAERAEEVAKAERRIRLEREYTEVAKSYNLPIRDDVLGGVLMRCAESLSREDCQVIAKALEAAGESVFQEVGSIGGGDNSDVLAQVNAFADAEVSKSSGITRDEFLVDVFSTHPELYDEYLNEKR